MGRGAAKRSPDLLARIAALLGTARDSGRTLRQALTVARSALGAHTMGVMMLDAADGALETIHLVWARGRVRQSRRVPADEAPLFKKVRRTRRAATIALASHRVAWIREAAARGGDRFLALAPIFRSGRVVGALITTRATRRPFSRPDLSLLEGVARILGSLLSERLEGQERRGTDSSRRASDRLFQALLDGADALLYVRDRKGRYLMVNHAGARLLKRAVDEIIGRTVDEFFSAEEAARIRASDAAVMKQDGLRRYEDSLTFPSGVRRFLVSKQPFRDDRGRLVGVIGVAQDITELRRSEAQLRENEAFHSIVLNNLSEGVSVVDRDGRPLTMNAEARNLLGYGTDPPWVAPSIRDPVWDPVRLDGSRLPPEEFASTRALSTGRAVSGHVLGLRRSDGSRIWISLNAVPLFHEGERQPYAVVTSFSDISQRRAIEEALQRSEARYRGIVEGQQDLICRYTPDCVLTFVNASYARYFGKTPEELVGTSFLDFVPEAAQEPLRRRVRDLVESRGTLSLLEEAIDGRGERRMQFWQDHVVATAPGESIELQAVGRDVTDETRAREQLRRSHEELRALAVRLQKVREEERKRIAREIHDGLGQALTAIRMDLQWLRSRFDRDDSGTGKPRRPSPAELRDKLGAASRLIDETLTLVRRIATDLRPGVLDHVGLLAAIEWEARQFESRAGIRCSVRSATGEPALEPDTASAVYRIFQEALTNVARHARASSVSVSLADDAGWLRLDIEDDGVGIDATVLESGASLGLLGMRERALGLGGQLSVGVGLKGGTQVSLRLPRAGTPEVAS